MKTDFYSFTTNKAKIVAYPMFNVPTIEIRVLIRAGSWYEDGPNWGAFHLLEHLMLEATEKFPKNQILEQYAKKHGIIYDGWTNGGQIGFSFRFLSCFLDQGLQLVEELIFHPLLPTVAFKRETNVIKQEYLENWDYPNTCFDHEIRKEMFGSDHPYVRDALGQPEFIQELKRKDLQKLHKQFFKPQNIVMSIVGDIKTQEVKGKIQKLFADKTNNYLSDLPTIEISGTKRGSFWYQKDIDRSEVSICWLTTGIDNTSLIDQIKFELTAFILGSRDFFTSLLVSQLRQELGLVYGTGAYWSYWPKAGFLEAWATTKSDNINEVIEKIQIIVKNFIKDGIQVKEFIESKNMMNWLLLMDYDSVPKIAERLVAALFWHNRVIPPEEWIEISKDLTVQKVCSFVNQFLTEGKAKIGVMSKEEIIKSPKPEH